MVTFKVPGGGGIFSFFVYLYRDVAKPLKQCISPLFYKLTIYCILLESPPPYNIRRGKNDISFAPEISLSHIPVGISFNTTPRGRWSSGWRGQIWRHILRGFGCLNQLAPDDITEEDGGAEPSLHLQSSGSQLDVGRVGFLRITQIKSYV